MTGRFIRFEAAVRAHATFLTGLLVLSGWFGPARAESGAASTSSPRLLFTAADVDAIRLKLADGGDDARAYASILSRWQTYSSMPVDSLLTGPMAGSNVAGELGLMAYLENPGTPQRQKLRALVLLLVSTADADQDDFATSMRLRTLALGYDLGFANAPTSDKLAVQTEIESYLAYMQSQSNYSAYAFNPYTSNRGMTVGSSMGLAAIAIWDDVPQSEHPFLLASLQFADVLVDKCLNDLLGSEGAYREGVLYGAWTMRMALPYIEARRRFDGVDLAGGHALEEMAGWLAYQVLPEAGGHTNNLNDSPWFSCPLAAHSTILDWLKMSARSALASWVYRRVAGDLGAPENDTADRTATVLWDRSLPEIDPATLLPPSKLFVDRGFYAYRSGWKSGAAGSEVLFTFQAGRFFGGHAQEDQGQFTLYADGDRYALDHGSAYPTALPKETESHNLVLIDARGQHNAGNSIGTDATIATALQSPFGDYLRADLSDAYTTHSPFNDPGVPFPDSDWSWGYDGGNPVERADRMVAVVHGPEAPPWFWIADDIRKDGAEHTYDWLLHTDASNTVGLQGDPVMIHGATSRLAVWFANPRPPELVVSSAPFANGGEDPATTRLVARSRSVELHAVVALVPLPSAVPPPEAQIVQEETATTMQLDWGNVQDVAISNPTGTTIAGPVRTDARMAVVRMEAGAVVSWVLGEGRSLSYKTLDLVMLEPATSASLAGPTVQLDRSDVQFVVYGPGITSVLGPDGTPLTFVREGPWIRSVDATPHVGNRIPGNQLAKPEDRTMQITIDCAPSVTTRVTVYDVRGRLVRTLPARSGASGRLVTWDGRNARGNQVAAGVYIARVVGCAEQATQKVIVVH